MPSPSTPLPEWRCCALRAAPRGAERAWASAARARRRGGRGQYMYSLRAATRHRSKRTHGDGWPLGAFPLRDTPKWSQLLWHPLPPLSAPKRSVAGPRPRTAVRWRPGTASACRRMETTGDLA
eukprot:scaffold1809_cov386-Prasinococcus_capsulatus_cf.AAC.33